MIEKYPKDRFDQIPADVAKVGAHRAPRPPWHGWFVFAWAALATGILVTIGVVGLFVANGRIDIPSAGSSASSTPAPTPTTTPTVNPRLTVTVLNGTMRSGLATSAGATLTKAGWKVIATANSNDRAIKTTTVYYQVATNRAAALGIGRSIPGARVALTQDYAETGSDLTVVLGANFTVAR